MMSDGRHCLEKMNVRYSCLKHEVCADFCSGSCTACLQLPVVRNNGNGRAILENEEAFVGHLYGMHYSVVKESHMGSIHGVIRRVMEDWWTRI